MALDLNQRWPILANWKFFFVIGLPLVLLPLLIIEDHDTIDVTDSQGHFVETRTSTKYKCAFVIILMAIYWMVEAIPLAITSLLPIVFFPLFGVQSTSDVSINYMKETNMMFVGGIIIALAVEYSNLHKRIALRVMTIIGSSPMSQINNSVNGTKVNVESDHNIVPLNPFLMGRPSSSKIMPPSLLGIGSISSSSKLGLHP